MIAVSPSSFVLIYLTVTFIVLFFLWFRFHFKNKKKILIPQREDLYLCEYCHSIYLSDPLTPNTQCPLCKSLNKNNHFKSQTK